MTRVLFASWHWYLDQSNGASITTRETLLALARRGWDVKTFCGAATDFFTPPNVDEILTSSGVAGKKRFDGGVGESAFRAVAYRDSGVDSVGGNNESKNNAFYAVREIAACPEAPATPSAVKVTYCDGSEQTFALYPNAQE